MKLYLSSYQIGSEPELFSGLFGQGKQVGVIRNALDYSTDSERLERGRQFEFEQLESIGLSPQALDLREYFDRQAELSAIVQQLDGLWVVGGNTFVLRRAMKRSGLDDILLRKLDSKQFVYAGYSAGICAITPTLKGIHLADDPDIIPAGYTAEVLWDGLGLVPFCIAPHYRSDHPESQMIEQSVQYFIEHKLPFIALKDGEVYIDEVESMPTQRIQRTVF